MFCSVRLLAAILGCLVLLCAPASATGPALPDGFVAEPLAEALDAPTGFAHRPDGTMYVIEKAGRVHRVTPTGARALWLDLNASPHVPPVNAWWDRGLVGVAVDGQWPDHRFVYLLYVSDGWHDADDGRQDDDPHSSLLVRVPVRENGAAGVPEVILGADGMGDACPGPFATPEGELDTRDYNDVDCLPIDGDTHAVGTVRAAADGTLYLGSGDGAGFDGVDQRALRSQREDSLAGKIMHVDRDGRGLAGHAFCPSATERDRACTKLHSIGFRNPFRFALTPDGRLAVGDVGWGAREELTIPAAGANAGWPCWEGSLVNETYAGAQLCRRVITSAQPPTPVGVALPDWEYDRVGSGGSIVGGPAYTGTGYPASYRGSLLVGDYAQGWLRHIPADGAGGWSFAPTPVLDWAATSARPLVGTAVSPGSAPWAGVDIGTHPANGDVVYADIGEVSPFGAIRPNSGSIVRIRYVPGNARPVARATATPEAGPAPLTVEFSAAGSSDPDGDALTYAWDFDLDGEADASTATVGRAFPRAGAYTVRLTVTDRYGLGHSTTVTVRVAETPPVAEVLTTSDTTFAGAAPMTLRGRAIDAQDGELSGEALRWDVQLVHNDHTHLLGTYHGTQPAVPKAIDDHDSDTHYVITLTATDSAGLTDTVVWRLDPRTATVRLRSVPDSVRMQYGERSFVAPADHVSTVGLKTSVTVTDAFERGGERYVFSGWEDGITTRSRAFTVSAGGATLTARYNGLPRVALAPDLPSSYRAGEALTLGATGHDPDDGALTAGALRWRVQRTVGGAPQGDPATGTGIAFGFVADTADEPDATYVVSLTASDRDGATATATATLRPRTARIGLRTDPPGGTLTYGANVLADGVTRRAVVGANVPLSAPARHGDLDFLAWSDRLTTPARRFEVPANDATLTARYAAAARPAPPTVAPPAPGAQLVPPADTRGAGVEPGTVRAGRLTLERLRGAGIRAISGRLIDLARARRVDVALLRRQGAGCAWWSGVSHRFSPGSCRSPRWLPATVRGATADRRWRRALGGPLPAGVVTVRIRARDSAGAVLARGTVTRTVPG